MVFSKVVAVLKPKQAFGTTYCGMPRGGVPEVLLQSKAIDKEPIAVATKRGIHSVVENWATT